MGITQAQPRRTMAFQVSIISDSSCDLKFVDDQYASQLLFYPTWDFFIKKKKKVSSLLMPLCLACQMPLAHCELLSQMSR